MNSTSETAPLRFEPPGPGSWELDAVHFPRPATRYLAETHPEPFRRGVRDFTRFYGMLIDGLEYRSVNGFVYKTVHPVAPEDIPARFQRAEEVFQKKLWREQLRDWDETVKPASITAHRELQAVDPDALSDEELIAYLTRCRRHHAEMIAQHMRHTAAAVVPTGDFLAHVGDWTGLAPAELLDLMRGASPVSSGASAELDAADRRDGEGSARPRAARLEGRPGSRARRPSLAGRRGRRGDDRLSRPRGQPASRRLRHQRAARDRASGRVDAGDPRRCRGNKQRSLGRRAADRGRSRQSPRGASGRVRRARSARRGSCIGCATSGACSATSGHPG